MDADNLVRMANRIGEFFVAMPDHDEALQGIASHIRKFWAPRMRSQLAAAIADGSADGLSSIVTEALERHAEHLHPEEPAPGATNQRPTGG